jgi:hypothetical protein
VLQGPALALSFNLRAAIIGANKMNFSISFFYERRRQEVGSFVLKCN